MQSFTDIDKTIVRNQKEYPEIYNKMKWLKPAEAREAAAARENLVDDILRHSEAQWGFQETKLYTHTLSPGCALCGDGHWSCLFINGICNARCFYCPASQKEAGLPMANSLTFEHPEAYADYVNRFHIKGVSFSGGEPLLSFERVKNFLQVLHSQTGHDVYTWMYTNGLLVTREKLTELKAGGLNEIRFDLSADDYKLDALEKAVGIIPKVTVEIPAIPEDLGRTKELIRTLHQMGVDHLNLHQIRCTPFNSRKLMDRGYTFIHGPKVTVLDTELAALELIRYSLDHGIAMPINYCSFTYRHQYQGTGARKRYAGVMKEPYEDVTGAGYIRHMKAIGNSEYIEGIHQTLINAGVDEAQLRLTGKNDSLSFSAGLLPLINVSNVQLKVSYSTAVIRPSVTYRHPFKTITLNNSRPVVVEKQPARPALVLTREDVEIFKSFLASGDVGKDDDQTGGIRQILLFEKITMGLAPYY